MKLHDFKVETLSGDPFDFSQLEGKKVLIVNTASECGLTPQYEELEALYKEHGGDSFEIIGFPCNDFGGQEPGSAKEIQSFCQKNYGVTFPIMEKVHVKGDQKHPLFDWMLESSKEKGGLDNVKWNFQKFLVDKDGSLNKIIEPTTVPSDALIKDWIHES